jgi:hypothetical protein
MNWTEPLWNWADANSTLLWWLFAASLALFVLAPLAVVWVVIQLPADYFLEKRRGASPGREKHPWWPLVLIAKNLLGILLLLAGLVMLFVPGQGLLTLAAGLILVDFPGKFRLQRWLVLQRPVWRSLNWLRRRAGREPLRRPSGRPS